VSRAECHSVGTPPADHSLHPRGTSRVAPRPRGHTPPPHFAQAHRGTPPPAGPPPTDPSRRAPPPLPARRSRRHSALRPQHRGHSARERRVARGGGAPAAERCAAPPTRAGGQLRASSRPGAECPQAGPAGGVPTCAGGVPSVDFVGTPPAAGGTSGGHPAPGLGHSAPARRHSARGLAGRGHSARGTPPPALGTLRQRGFPRNRGGFTPLAGDSWWALRPPRHPPAPATRDFRVLRPRWAPRPGLPALRPRPPGCGHFANQLWALRPPTAVCGHPAPRRPPVGTPPADPGCGRPAPRARRLALRPQPRALRPRSGRHPAPGLEHSAPARPPALRPQTRGSWALRPEHSTPALGAPRHRRLSPAAGVASPRLRGTARGRGHSAPARPARRTREPPGTPPASALRPRLPALRPRSPSRGHSARQLWALRPPAAVCGPGEGAAPGKGCRAPRLESAGGGVPASGVGGRSACRRGRRLESGGAGARGRGRRAECLTWAECRGAAVCGCRRGWSAYAGLSGADCTSVGGVPTAARGGAECLQLVVCGRVCPPLCTSSGVDR
jgi:hypothetical protein